MMTTIRPLALMFFLSVGLVAPAVKAELIFADNFETLRYQPELYESALRNPMKGFTAHAAYQEWATLRHAYFRWNELENHESDGLDKIVDATNQRFANGPASNIKYIVRVYLHWSQDHQKYWPEDMQEDDYTSEQFQARLLRLVERLGQAWNGDPRVAFIELGIFGKWGEHHSPSPTEEMQQIAGHAFHDAFPDKLVSVRHVWEEFEGFGFGEYWDSWGHYQQMWSHGQRIAEVNEEDGLYMSNYMGGEVAYGWGMYQIQPGANPTASVSEPAHREFMINSIRWLHGTQLRWISQYDHDDPIARAGAEEMQRVMGYRFVLEEVGFNSIVDDQGLKFAFSVRNEGSAPFYYRWPVELALHDPETRELVWREQFDSVDIRLWGPGRHWTPPQWESVDHWPGHVVVDGWSSEPIGWGVPPQSHRVSQVFHPDLPAGEYVLSLAVLDPAGMTPSLRFASSQYWNGGRHPVGLVGIDRAGRGKLPDDFVFDDPADDDSLNYVFETEPTTSAHSD